MLKKDFLGLPGISSFTFLVCSVCGGICEARLNLDNPKFMNKPDKIEEEELDILSRYTVANHHAPEATPTDPCCKGSRLRPLAVLQSPTRPVLNLKESQFEVINTAEEVLYTFGI